MATNHDPTHITNALWRHWEECLAVIPGLRLGGIYANKQCYHNTVTANKKSWPGAYCVQLPPDLTGPYDKARAIDLTMSTAEMKKRTGYLKRAAEHPTDDRLNCLREFIGTLDGVKVFCMIKDGVDGAVHPWRVDWSRDPSHLWHIHESVFTEYCGIWDGALEAVTSVIAGETYEEYLGRKGGDEMWFFQLKDGTIGRADGVTLQLATSTAEWEGWQAAAQARTGLTPIVKWQEDPAHYVNGDNGKDITNLTPSDAPPSGEVPQHQHDNVTISGGSLTGKTGGVTATTK